MVLTEVKLMKYLPEDMLIICFHKKDKKYALA